MGNLFDSVMQSATDVYVKRLWVALGDGKDWVRKTGTTLAVAARCARRTELTKAEWLDACEAAWDETVKESS